MAQKNLGKARKGKNDEFYTQLTDIEKELKHYKAQFKNKVVLCNCDDPRVSNFFHYFFHNFEVLGLKKLITTCYKNDNSNIFTQNTSEKAVYLEYTGDKNGNRVPDPEEIGIKNFKGDGDFRSKESIELLKQADIVCTNPPFSLFREYVAQLMKYKKKFLIIGNMNAITYKEIFPLIKANKLWAGYGFNQSFVFQTTYENNLEANRKFCEQKGYFGKNYIKTPAVNWYTNLEVAKRKEEITLYKTYTPQEYPKYDNYDAIEVAKVVDIPMDYDGVMGVPITFLDKHNPDQFELLGSNRGVDQDPNSIYGKGSYIGGKETYKRLFIRKK
ncbi:putative adenine-specific methylase [candidate division SR1 bacterium]|nr:putative adenine-specific methylase [candidate division SR1 bacterium]